MGQIGSALGFGYQSASGSGQQSETSSSAYSPTYSAGQGSLQDQLGAALKLLVGNAGNGTMSAPVQALKTQSADAINTTAATTQDRADRYLASRGFGKSGTAGQTALQIDLGRQGALAKNESDFAGLQLDQNQKSLMDALGFAFANPGRTASGTSSGTSSGESSGWGLSAGLSGGFKV